MHSMYIYIFQRETARWTGNLEKKSANSSTIRLLFDKDLKVLVDDRHGQQNSSSTSNGTYGQRTQYTTRPYITDHCDTL